MAKRIVDDDRDPNDIRAMELELELEQEADNSLLKLDSELGSGLEPEHLPDATSGITLAEDDRRLYQEKLRQEMGDFETSISERERGIRALEEAQEILEDQLEDANNEIDRLRRELEKMSLETEEAKYQQREAEEARKKLENALYKMQEGVEDAKVVSMRDERLHQSIRPLGFSSITRGPMLRGALIGVAAGMGALLVLLELLALIGGGGELFSLIFG